MSTCSKIHILFFYRSYWAALLTNMNVDIRAYDISVNKKNCWSKVRNGGPEVLLNPRLNGNFLILEY